MRYLVEESIHIKTALDAVNDILKNLTQLDRINTKEEFNQKIEGLMCAIGRSTNSDRSYVLEWSSSKKESFHFIYEWCADGVFPVREILPYVPTQKIPNWMERLNKGEAIVSADWEADHKHYPMEYEYFEGQGLKNLIIIPIFANSKLIGFLGLDNPEKDLSDLILQMLTSVAGHLGSLSENFYIKRQLKKKEERLSESLQEIDFEKQLLNALSIDYTVVYFCDLLEDYVIPVRVGKKIDIGNAEGNWWQRMLKERSDSYSARMESYYEHLVIKESAVDFLEKLNSKHIMQVLERKERMLYRFRTKPNPHGQQHFEVQFVRLSNLSGFKVVMGFRYVDDMVAEEERQKIALESALADANLKNEIVSSISKIYWIIYRMDLENDMYEEISSGEEIHRLTGVTGKITEIVTKMTNTVVEQKYREKLQAFLDVATLAERLSDVETVAMEYPTTNGSWHIARFIVKKRDEQGKVTHVLYLVRELSKQKQQEMEYEKRLAAMALEAQQANIAKTDFLRRMSHDIRTPINGIRGMVSMAQKCVDDPEKLNRCRDKIMESTGYLLELVNNVLDMNKLESGNIIMEHIPFDLYDLFRESNALIEMQCQMNGVTFIVDNHDICHPHLLGSPVHFKQILQNIVGNAVKYTGTGGTVRVSCEEEYCENGKAMFKLVCEDNGIGMSKDFISRIFEPFAQAESDARTKYMGTGLGMSIVKQLIDRMDGSISVESEEGVGSIFTFHLPFDVNWNFGEEESKEKEEAELSLRGVRVLLVEDNDLNMEIAKFHLEEEGMVVTAAWNGQEAVEKFEQSELYYYDVVLMDIMMPILNGLEATKKIRLLNRNDAKTTPILAMTANAFLEDVQQSREAGMNAHLAKPLDAEKLLNAIKKHIRR